MPIRTEMPPEVDPRTAAKPKHCCCLTAFRKNATGRRRWGGDGDKPLYLWIDGLKQNVNSGRLGHWKEMMMDMTRESNTFLCYIAQTILFFC